MIAHINLPGSQHFDWMRGTRKECEEWLAKQKEAHKNLYQGAWTSTYFPNDILTEREARKWRYADGDRCFDDVCD